MLTALRFRDFRLLWTSQTVSVLGDGLVLTAVGLYVTDLTGDPRDVGIVLTAYVLPLVGFLLFGGVLADRLPRTQVMVATDLVRGLLHGTLAVLIATGTVQIWHMVVIGALFSSTEAFFRPAYTGLVPQTVPEDQIQGAQALSGVSRELAEVASPALATALVLGVGGAAAFAVDAATFAVSALLLLRVQARERGEPARSSTVLADLREGWRAVRERAWVGVTVLCFSVSLLLALAPFYVLGPAQAQALYGTSSVWGISNAAWGVGTLTGAVLAGRWRPEHPMRAGLLGAAPWPLVITVFGLGPPRVLLYTAMALAGAGIGVFAVWWETALAERIPAHLLSRVAAWDLMGSMALLPLGYLVAGPVGAALGQREVLLFGGLAGTAVMVLALVPRSTRALRRTSATSLPTEPAGVLAVHGTL